MKKPRKKPRPELRVRINRDVFTALKLAAARRQSSPATIVENALMGYWMVKSELEERPTE